MASARPASAARQNVQAAISALRAMQEEQAAAPATAPAATSPPAAKARAKRSAAPAAAPKARAKRAPRPRPPGVGDIYSVWLGTAERTAGGLTRADLRWHVPAATPGQPASLKQSQAWAAAGRGTYYAEEP